MTDEAILAVKRFGLGPTPADDAGIAADPRGSVLQQLAHPAASLASGRTTAPELPASAHAAWIATRRHQIETNILANRKLAANLPAADMRGEMARPGEVAAKPGQPARPPDPAGLLYQAEVDDRFRRGVASGTPFLERLVWFWSNHFCIAANKDQQLRAIAGAYEREAIRPHVLGRFRDMLGAVVHHPAMLIYLDNRGSIGPASLVGRWRQRGLNENLAREIMELHTLGVDGGYSQADVTQFARVLTGWTVTDMDAATPGATVFLPEAHDPGPIDVLGQTLAEPGVDQLDRMLDRLARHPATARFIAGKLVAHFAGPSADPALAETLADRFRETDGDLGEVARALVTSDHAWADLPPRVVPPWDYAVAVGRALEQEIPVGMILHSLDLLGQRTWEVPSPKGWADDEDWGGSAALIERLDWADEIGRRFAGQRDVPALAQRLFGASLSTETATAIRRAESRQQAVALLLMSPEFQRR